MPTSKKKAPTAPKYRHHKARDCAVVTIDGQDKYLGPYDSDESHEKYDRLVAEWRARRRGKAAPPRVAANDPSYNVKALCAEYLLWAQGYYVKNGEPSGHMSHVTAALRVLRRLYASVRCADFGPPCLEGIQATLVEAGRSRTYINDLCGEIRRVFKFGVRKQRIDVAIYQALLTVPGLSRGRTTARESEPIGPVDDAIVEATAPHLPPVVTDMVQLQRLTGCRPGELCILRPCDVDRAADVWVYTPSTHKTEHHGRARKIFIGPQGQDLLLPYLLRPAEAFCFSPADSRQRQFELMREKRKTRVQPSQACRKKARPKRQPLERYTKDSYCRAVVRACDKANVPHWSPNRLRHAAATEIRKLYGLEAAACVLGHSKADVTQIYAERDFATAAKVIAQIG